MLTFKQFIAEQQELSLEDFSVEELQEFMQTEEYEQLDELSKGTLASYIDKAAKKATEHGFNAGVQAMDRINPETPKKIQAQIDKSLKRQKGITAAVKRLTKEEEQLDELSKSTLASYIPKAAASMSSIDRDVESKRDKKASAKDIQKRQDKSSNRAFGISLAAQKLATEEEQLEEGGEKHAFRMGMQHGAKGAKKIDAEKSFGVFAKDYHRGYEHGKDSADWHDDKASKAPLSVRAKYQESEEQLGESAGDLPDSYHKIMVDQGFKKTKTSDSKDGTTHSYSHPDGSEAHYTVRHKTWGGVQIETKHGAARKTGIRTA